MRIFLGALAIIALLLLGFLPTPDNAKFLAPDYLLKLNQLSEPLRSGQKDISDIDNQINALTVQQVRTTTNAASETDPVRKEKLAAEATLQTANIVLLRNRKAALEKQQVEMQTKLDLAASDATNLSLVLRALALGAIGALLSILAKSLATTNQSTLFAHNNGFGRVPASMLMGALIAVVAVALFYTGFISIFSATEKTSGSPDFWKVTVLALLAGAFADRLFQAAAYRIDRYADQFERTGAVPGAAATAPAATRRKSRSRKTKTAAPDNPQPKRLPSLVPIHQSDDSVAVGTERTPKTPS